MVDTAEHWAQVIAAASAPPRSERERHKAVKEALGLGSSITRDSVGCSITETTPNGFRTPAASSDVALALDLAQYHADDGPCVAACRDGRIHSVVVMEREAGYTSFTAAALAHGVRSSLSLPLYGTSRASALNLYASDTSAFETGHARNVADLLSRCVAALVPDSPRTDAAGADGLASRAASDSAHEHVTRARRILEARYDMDATTAYFHLTQLSRTRQRSVILIAREIVADAGQGADPHRGVNE